ncbi:Muskelin N-terminus-domain-containing protein [Parasitella parasitica]|nr:Muskelin N-terminus-domain-containing protein [Parasitella parasitica]
MGKAKEVQLSYTIFDYSSHSGSYHPQNIMVNKPTQQASRWSSGLHDHEQYITIKLDKTAVARSITFGKFHKGHVCNLKEFKVFGGMDPKEDMIEILHNGLKNDTEPETFALKNQHGNMIFPVRYIKIVPLSAFGANFNYSIWYVVVRGANQENIIQRVCAEYENYKETETTRLCLKYFRQKNMMDVFHILKNRTGVELEHPLVSDLHRCLVVDADFIAAEQVLHTVYQRNMYKPYTDSVKYAPIWRQIQASNEDGEAPCARGGHQMCIDVQDRMIYILGGWDGKHDLSDFWCYDIRENRWSLLSIDTRMQGGPSPRSCHKICFDPVSRSIFVLGRYVESPAYAGQTLESDFYRYYIEFDQWVKINESTAEAGGPELVYDHQMCIDPDGEMLYVFGGRTVTGDTAIQNYSGFYSFNIKTNHWKLVRQVIYVSRVGHSMLFDQKNKSLYIFAGQRGKDYLSDLYRYQVDKDIVTEIAQDYSKDAGPDAGFTQRATIDEDLQELYVLSGYMRNSGGDIVRNTLWVYSIEKNEWQKVFQNENRDSESWARISKFEPGPRFAHQMVYDPVSKKQYIFGGNPGDNSDTTKRLDDFWELVLSKPDPSSILQKSFYMIRMQKLKELCSKVCNQQRHHSDEDNDDTMIALDYLRSQVAPVVNHENESESKDFHQICANFCLLETLNDDNEQDDSRDLFISDIMKSEGLCKLCI